MKNSKSCYSRLLFGVMTFNQQRKFILAAEKNLLFSIKTLSLCFFLEGFFLFFDLDCQNLATLGFDNCPISEKENLSQKKKFRPRVFLPLSNLFLATKNIYSHAFSSLQYENLLAAEIISFLQLQMKKLGL